ncbi:MAG: acyltransferase [Proteobacteria bacterium]|nr:acyltransferase [Pseudomonadota bacterium]
MQEPKRRNDIDGLRALAVLSITIFHINPNVLPGGFLGVDVFFVISGFLISGQIYKQYLEGSFSLLDFYARRMRRLFPALFVLLSIVALVSWFLLLPPEMAAFSNSLSASVLQIANVYFYWNVDYFASDTVAPLLHIWSLSVEEQFYLFMPLILTLLISLSPGRVVLFLSVIAVLSLCLAEYWIYVERSDLAFYMVASRVWEFMAGAIVATLSRTNLDYRLRNLFIAVSVLVLLVAFALYREDIHFPGVGALAPVLGTAAILYAGRDSNVLASRLLGLPPLAYLGRISYSVYLYHWPIIIFYELLVSSDLTYLEQAGLMVASLACGAVSYHAVERPAGRLFATGRPEVPLVTGVFAMVALAGAGIFVLANNGMPSRFPDSINRIASYAKYSTAGWRARKCYLISQSRNLAEFSEEECVKTAPGKLNILLIGDSHASHYYLALKDLLPEANVSQISAIGCRPLVGVPMRNLCGRLFRKAFVDIIPRRKFDVIFVSARWQDQDDRRMPETITYLQQFAPKVVLIGPSIRYDVSFPRLLATSHILGAEIPERQSRQREVSKIDSDIRRVLPERNYVSAYAVQCPSGRCLTEVDGVPILFDKSHLTYEGSKAILEVALRQAQIP